MTNNDLQDFLETCDQSLTESHRIFDNIKSYIEDSKMELEKQAIANYNVSEAIDKIFMEYNNKMIARIEKLEKTVEQAILERESRRQFNLSYQ